MPTFVAGAVDRAAPADPSPAVARPARQAGIGIRWALTVLAVSLLCMRADARPSPNQPPSDLLVSVAIGPVTTLRSLVAYIEKISPGASAGLTDRALRRGLAELVGASSLDGFDPTSWTYVLVASVDGAPGFALVGKVTDARTLATSAGSAATLLKGGWAAIGAKPVLARVGAYALAAIAAQPAPRAPSATVYLPHVLARYRTEIEATRARLLASLTSPNSGALAPLMTAYVDGLASLAADTDRLVVTFDATPDTAALDLSLAPRPSSRLAKFIALQRPTDYALIEQLPALTPTVLIGGHLDSGPYRDGMFELVASMYGPAVSPDLRAAMEVFRKAMTGELAMAMQITPGTGLSFTQLFGLSDPGAANQAISSMLQLFKTARTFDMMGISTTVRANPDAANHDGVALRSYDTIVDLSKLPGAQQQAMAAALPDGKNRAYLATFDGLGMVVVSKDSLGDAKRAIDARRGRHAHLAIAPAFRDLFAASRTRKDSIAMVMDLGAVVGKLTGDPSASGLPLLLSLGCPDRSAHLRIALPAATLQAVVNARKP